VCGAVQVEEMSARCDDRLLRRERMRNMLLERERERMLGK